MEIGETIAQTLGLKYDGKQEVPGSESRLQFTDPETGTTFYGNTLEEVKSRMLESREKFTMISPDGSKKIEIDGKHICTTSSPRSCRELTDPDGVATAIVMERLHHRGWKIERNG